MAMHKIIILSFTILSVCCLSSCLEPNHFNHSASIVNGGLAKATWYGNPSGDGTDGGACGFKNIISQPPYSSLVTAVGQSLYKDGESCGECYQVSCDQSQNTACSGKPVRVVITDSCPKCLDAAVRFDLSGTAFGALAVSGQEAQLRNAGALQINYERVPCQYGNTKIAFRVDEGSNIEYLAVAVEFEDGDGDLGGVALSQGGSNSGWEPMQHSWGAVWKFQAGSGSSLQGPISFRLTSMTSGKTVEAENVIPAGWHPGATYQSSVNF